MPIIIPSFRGLLLLPSAQDWRGPGPDINEQGQKNDSVEDYKREVMDFCEAGQRKMEKATNELWPNQEASSPTSLKLPGKLHYAAIG